MPLLDYAVRANRPEMGLLSRVYDFLAERQDFANNRMRQLRESEWRPWEWDYDTRAAEMRGLLAGQAGGGPEPDWTSAVGDALGTGVIPGALGILAGPKGAARVPGLLDKLEDAKAMVAKGAADEDVWQATGWWVRTPDGVPRWEIPDLNATYHPGRVKASFVAQHDRAASQAFDAAFVRKIMDDEGVSVGMAKDRYKEIFGRDPEQGAGSLAQRFAWSELSRIYNRMESARLTPQAKWSDYMEHPQFNQAYPDISDMPTGMTEVEPFTKGSYRGGRINLNPAGGYELPGGRSTMLHETQHAVEDIEDMAKGGSIAEFSLGTRERTIRDAEILRSLMNDNPNNWSIEVFNEFRSALGRDPEPGAIQTALRTKWDKLLEMLEDPTRKYRRLAGEAEARAVQARADQPIDWLKMHGPWESYDVPLDELLIRK